MLGRAILTACVLAVVLAVLVPQALGNPAGAPAAQRETSVGTEAPAATLTPARDFLPLLARQPTPTHTPTQTPTNTPQIASVHVRSARLVVDGTTAHVYGEVENTTAAPVYFVRIVGKFYAGTAFVATESTGTMLYKTDPAMRNPFDLVLFNAPAGVNGVTFDLSYQPSSVFAIYPATITSEQTRDNFGLEVFGELRNDTSQVLKSIEVVVTFYDTAGEVYYTDLSFIDQQSLGAGQIAVYKVSTFHDDLAGLAYTVQAQGYVAP